MKTLNYGTEGALFCDSLPIDILRTELGESLGEWFAESIGSSSSGNSEFFLFDRTSAFWSSSEPESSISIKYLYFTTLYKNFKI